MSGESKVLGLKGCGLAGNQESNTDTGGVTDHKSYGSGHVTDLKWRIISHVSDWFSDQE